MIQFSFHQMIDGPDYIAMQQATLMPLSDDFCCSSNVAVVMMMITLMIKTWESRVLGARSPHAWCRCRSVLMTRRSN